MTNLFETAEQTSNPERPAGSAPRFAVRLTTAIVAATVAAVVAGWWTPRGPVSSAQALATMAVGLTVGMIAGAAMRSRWAMVVASVAFIAIFELVRLGATGPTVDAISLTSTYGIMAFVVGRAFHGLLVLLPMVVGVAYGRVWSRRHNSAPPGPSPSRLRRAGRSIGKAALVASTVTLLLLAVALLRPASTSPIVGADGKPLPGSIAELHMVEVGGHDQSLLIRGDNVHNPVLLFLAGGPGGSEVGAMSRYAELLERDFVVVTWDQLGTGRSTGQFDPDTTLSFQGAVADTIDVSNYLRGRFGVDRVYLAGNSYGTILGVRAVQAHPELYAAFVGAGQMVDVTATDQMFYNDALAYADATGDSALANTLRANGLPPYDDLLKMAPIVESEHEWNDYSDIPGFPGLREPTDNLFVTEYGLMDQVRSMAGLLDTYVALYPQLKTIDLRTDAEHLDVPVYMVLGAHEARGRAVLARQWFNHLDAPHKQLFVFERSGHRPWVQEPEAFHDVMATVLADTGHPGSPAAAIGRSDGDELLNLFARYNHAVWPAPVITYLVGLVTLGMLWRRPGRLADQLIVGLLAAMWLWLGVVFQGRFAAQLNPVLGAVYAALFIVQGGLFLRAGRRGQLSFRSSHGWATYLGWGAIGYALAVYPLLGIVLGHGYPEAPLFGVAPCPSTIATFGLLLLARRPVPRHLVIIPMVWAVLAPLAAIGQGVPEDIALAVIGVIATTCVAVRHRSPSKPDEANEPLAAARADGRAPVSVG